MKDAVDVTLRYFGFGGRGTALRLAAYVGNLNFEDERYHWVDDDEKSPKKKAKDFFDFKFGTLPEIVVPDDEDDAKNMVVGHSNVCLKVIGHKGKLYPADVFYASRCDKIMDLVEDIMSLFVASEKIKQDEAKLKKQREQLAKDKLPAEFDKLEKLLKQNASEGNAEGFCVGNSFTVADCKLGCFIRHFGGKKEDWRENYYKFIPLNILDPCPYLKKYKEMFLKNEILPQFEDLDRKNRHDFKATVEQSPEPEKHQTRKSYYWPKRVHETGTVRFIPLCNNVSCSPKPSFLYTNIQTGNQTGKNC